MRGIRVLEQLLDLAFYIHGCSRLKRLCASMLYTFSINIQDIDFRDSPHLENSQVFPLYLLPGTQEYISAMILDIAG